MMGEEGAVKPLGGSEVRNEQRIIRSIVSIIKTLF